MMIACSCVILRMPVTWQAHVARHRFGLLFLSGLVPWDRGEISSNRRVFQQVMGVPLSSSSISKDGMFHHKPAIFWIPWGSSLSWWSLSAPETPRPLWRFREIVLMSAGRVRWKYGWYGCFMGKSIGIDMKSEEFTRNQMEIPRGTATEAWSSSTSRLRTRSLKQNPPGGVLVRVQSL